MWRWILWAALLPYAGWLIAAYDYHFIDNVNLVFHEAGHVFLTPFGQTAHFLGGTIMQLFFPAAVAIHFWRQEKIVESCIGIVWFAESLMYAAHYMSDANAQRLPLVGGGVHDWHFLFRQWGLLGKAEMIGTFFHLLAAGILIAALILMAKTIAALSPSPQRRTR